MAAEMAAAKSKSVLTLDQIQAVQDVPGLVEVDVPEWGGVVKIRGLNRGEVLKINESDDDEEGNALALSSALVEPAVTLEQAQKLLAEKSLGPTNRIIDAILKASGITPGFRQG